MVRLSYEIINLLQQIDRNESFFTGHTDDFATMIDNLNCKYPTSKLIAVGFSLGGNLITKYLGEVQKCKPTNIIGGISICQGYNAVEYVFLITFFFNFMKYYLTNVMCYRGTKCLLNWQNLRRFYLYIMTENMKNIILKHRHVLLSEECLQRYNLNEREIIAAATLPDLDEAYTIRVHNFPTTQELYKWSSCLHYFDTIDKPMIFINAKDDPLIPDYLLTPVRNLASK